jgi:hypothetical protein
MSYQNPSQRLRARSVGVLMGALVLASAERAAFADDATQPAPSGTPDHPQSIGTAQGEPQEGLSPEPAHAESPHASKRVLLLRTVVVGEKNAKPRRAAEREAGRAEQLDKILTDAVQDLGLTLDVSDASGVEGGDLSDLDLLSRAQADRWIVYPSMELRGAEMVVRIAGVAPGSKVVGVRTEVVKPSELTVRAVVMLRDVVAAKPGEGGISAESRGPERATPPAFIAPARSQGRAILALNAALLGAFVGYSVQRSSGSDDPRLLYPLMALGTGVGLGGAAIVTEEWDVGLGDAWYLSAGAWWPALSGWYLARGSGDVARSTAYGTSVIASFGGLALATAALVVHHGMSEGGALLTHSGGAFGTELGALTEFAVRGTTQGPTPDQGIGYGAAAGVLLAGALATQIDIEPSRVLAVDLGAGLGALAGAAAASPFIFGERTPSGDRVFLVTTMATTVAGGVLSWLWTRNASPAKASDVSIVPYAGFGVPAPLGWHRQEPVPARDPAALGAGIAGTLP